jgi:putative ABC transport system permease protein
MRLVALLDDFAGDFQYAARWLRRSPAFTFVAVFTLAIGLGANAAVFTIVDKLLLDPLPYRSPERLVRIFEEHAAAGFRDFAIAPATLLTWRDNAKSFEEIAFFVGATRNLAGEGNPDVLQGVAVSTNLLQVLGVQPVLGRAFQDGDGRAGTDPVIIISNEFWKNRFASAPDIVGRTIRLDGQPYTIVGVLAPSFHFPASTSTDIIAADYLIPRVLSPAEEAMRGNHFLRAIARLKPGVGVEQANAEMQGIAEDLERRFPNANLGWRVKLSDVRTAMHGQTSKAALLLLGASAMVLLIGCVNVASLLLARSNARQFELAIRCAIGASRTRIVRQLAVEYFLLASLGGMAGLLLAVWGKDLVLLVAPQDVFSQIESLPNLRVLLFTLACTIATTLLFGIAPGWRIWRGVAGEQLKNGGMRLVSADRRTGGAQSRLITAETALAGILLFGGCTLSLSFLRLMAVEPGFDARQLLTFKVRMTPANYRDASKRSQTYAQILERIRTLSGVAQVAAATNPPFLGGDQNYGVSPAGASEPIVSGTYYSISPAYFDVMGIPLQKGRSFSPADGRDGLPVVVISVSIARTLFGESDPIGRRIRGLGAPREVIGVVSETKHHGLDAPTRGQLYVPYTQDTQFTMAFTVRATASMPGLMTSIRKEISEVDAELPLSEIRTMDDAVSASMARARFTMTLSTIFAVLAVLLAAVGTYGVLTFFVAERTTEVGLRMALGATAQDILNFVLINGLRPVAFGLAIAIVVSAAAFRFLDRFVFEPKPGDAWLLWLVSAIIVIVASISIYIPARRAARIDPMSALRAE